jgi:hypothetical protein
MTALRDNIVGSSSEALHSAANRFVTAALANDIAANALICLADDIRKALELQEAISQVFELFPVLDEPH